MSIFLVMVSRAAEMAYSSALGCFGRKIITIFMIAKVPPRTAVQPFSVFKVSSKLVIASLKSLTTYNVSIASWVLSICFYLSASYGSPPLREASELED